MFKYRAFIFFLFAMTVLLSAVLECNQVRESVSISATLDFENADLEIKHCLFLFTCSDLDLNLVQIQKIGRDEIFFIPDVHSQTLLRLLESHRIALPPPKIS